MAPPSKAFAPNALKVLVIVMGLLIVAASAPAASAPFTQRIAVPSGAQIVSMAPSGDRLIVHVRASDGQSTAYIVDPRTGALLGTVEFPPGAAR